MIAQRPLCSGDDGVSEVIGTILLISITVLAAAIVATFLFSQPHPEKIPSFNAVIWNDAQKIYIRHDGGDPLYIQTTKIYVNGIDKTSNFYLSTAPGPSWTTMSIGNVLVNSDGISPVSTVKVVYKGPGGSAVVIAST
jgi:FlaG/FlaF family flagellin (archaellin)